MSLISPWIVIGDLRLCFIYSLHWKMSIADDKKNIVILGGSYGGVSTAHYVLKHAVPKLPGSKSYQVILISTSSQTMCRPAAPRALISDAMFPQDKLFVSVPESFSQYTPGSIVFKQGTAAHASCRICGQLSRKRLKLTWQRLECVSCITGVW